MVDLSIYKKKSRLYSSLLTSIILAILVFIFFLHIINTPNPPYPEEGGGGKGTGIELNLGFDQLGSGDIQEDNITMDANVPEETPSDDENIATQDIEDAPVIQNKQADKKDIRKDTPKTTKTETQATPKVVKPTVNDNALYRPGKKTSDGTSNVSGNQGSPYGTNAPTYGNGGSGGSGGGTGGGIGTGHGKGIGSGSSYTLDLKGRTLEGALPLPAYNGQEEGIVAVEIIVNKNGEVTEAKYREKGSTTNDLSLQAAAIAAARKAKFKSKQDAAIQQKGTIYYNFRLR